MNLFKRKHLKNIYLVFPVIIIILGFYTLPNIMNFYYAFTDWSIFNDQVNFTGLKNYFDLTQAGYLWKDLLTTIKYAVVFMVSVNVYGLFLALLLEKKTRVNSFFRTVLFIPILLAPLAIGYLFKGILSVDGVLNNFISLISNSDFRVEWLGSINYTVYLIAILHAWRLSGLATLIYIAGLSTIPEELIESAKIEGAGFWQILKNIKIPLIGPSITINIIFNFLAALNQIAFVLSMTMGGPARTTETVNLFIYNTFSTGRLGYATAGSLVLFFVVVIISAILIPVLRKREVEL